MSDPERLLNGSAGALSAQLLRAGHDEAPSRRGFERTLAAVGVATTTLGAAGTAGALGSAAGTAGAAGTVGALGAAGKAATTLTLLSLAKWAGMGVAGGVMVSLAAHGIEARRTPTRAVTVIATTATHREVQGGAAPPGGVAAPPGMATGSSPATGAPPGGVTAPPGATTASSVAATPPPGDVTGLSGAATPSSASLTGANAPRAAGARAPLKGAITSAVDAANAPLAAEVAFVDRGRALVQRGDARGALATLTRYEAEFPERRLLPEVLFLRMEASFAAGDTARAETLARVIVRDYAQSPHAAPARALLARRARQN
jgi:TolA-binding protein